MTTQDAKTVVPGSDPGERIRKTVCLCRRLVIETGREELVAQRRSDHEVLRWEDSGSVWRGQPAEHREVLDVPGEQRSVEQHRSRRDCEIRQALS